jgi:hypothetical protein
MNGSINKNWSQRQRLGEHLVEAGLLTEAQVGVALADQSLTSLPFGEIVVMHGWVKEQTVDYILRRVVQPERVEDDEMLKSAMARQPQQLTRNRFNANNTRRGPTTQDDEGVNWVG